MSACSITKHLILLTTLSAFVSCVSVETRNKWIKSVAPSGDGTSSNNIVDDLSENIEYVSAGDNIYRGVAGSLSESWNSCPDDEELLRNASISCYGVKIMRRVMAQLLDTPRNFQLADGVQLVSIENSAPGDSSSSEPTSRSMQKDDNGLLSRFQKFLSSHELRIRIPDLLPSGEEWSRILQQLKSDKEASARKKDKGQGTLLAMGLMMKGMLTAMGLGGLGLLTMKALMVSAMALMLSAIVGIKKLTSKDDDHGGGHVVSVVPVHHSGGDHGHYRKRRSTDGDMDDPAWLAYRAYRQLFSKA
ncbi:uncharacterized protein Osi5 [Periplaneta americana]|uniref:uncharacterized protein Osi5 n=1 Tax=Periplaneta americana TaxID=6978 RepID=UPI0037E82FBD